MKNCLSVVLDKRDGGNLSQYLAVLSANIIVFITGIHCGWASPSLKKLMSDDYPFEVTTEDGSYIAIISFVGDIIGGISASFLIDKIGRRNTLLSLAFPYSLSFFLIAFSRYGTAFLYCARVLGGIGEGATFAVLPIYVAEVADPEIRGKLGTFQIMIISLGQLFVNIISEYTSIQMVAWISLLFPVIFFLVFMQLPETPYYLLSKNKKLAAMESLRILKRQSKVEKELDILDNDVQRQMSEQGGFKELFTIPANRKAFVLANFTRFFQQMTGVTAFGTYYQLLIENSTSFSPMIGSSILIFIQVAVIAVSSQLIDLYGRKSLLLISASLTTIILSILGTFIALRDFTDVDTTSFEILPLVMIVMFVIAFIVGFGAVTNILVAEMYSSSIKSKATALSSVNMSLMMIGTTKYYQYTADNMSMAVPFLTFASSTFFSTFFFSKFLIETKGKSLEMIQKELIGLGDR